MIPRFFLLFLKVKIFWSASMSGHIPKCIGTKCHNVRSYTQMHRREAPQCQVTYPNLYIAQWWSTRLSKLLTYRVWIFFYFGKKEKKKNARHASMMLLFDFEKWPLILKLANISFLLIWIENNDYVLEINAVCHQSLSLSCTHFICRGDNCIFM